MQDAGLVLCIDAQGAGACVGVGDGQVRRIHVGKPLRERTWYRVWASYDAAAHTLTVGQAPIQPAFMVVDTGSRTMVIDGTPRLDTSEPLFIAALGGVPVRGHYNGKIERPLVLPYAASETALLAALTAGLWLRAGIACGYRSSISAAQAKFKMPSWPGNIC